MKKHLYPFLLACMLLGATSARAQYCNTGLYLSACSDGDFIESFSTTGGTTNISNLNTSCNDPVTGYAYYSTQTHTTMQGSSVNFTIVNNVDYDEFYKIFVDWNGDNDFTDADETVYNATIIAGATINGSFTIPITAAPGTKRLRVRAVYDPTPFTACSQEDFGEIEDYNLAVTAAPACSGIPNIGTATASVANACASIPFSVSVSTTTVASGLTVKWRSRPVGGTTWTNIAGATTLTTSIPNQTVATEYQAIISCGTDSATSNILTIGQNAFTACYCSPQNGTTFASLAPENTIQNVTIAGTPLNYTTTVAAANAYTQVPATATNGTATLTSGTPYTVTIAIDEFTTDLAMWIDYNQDGTFTASEQIPLTINATNTSATGSFAVPTGTTAGQTGLRVMAAMLGPINTACEDMGVGEVEDYVVTIGGSGPACIAPASINISGVTASSANISWTAVAGAIGYEYLLDQSPSNPTITGSGTTAPSYNPTGLLANTTYYMHVRTNCSGGISSPWVTQSFTTTSSTGGCNAPTSVSATAVTGTTATVTWTAVSGATGYQYVVNTSPTPPSAAGANTTANNVPLSGLTAGTTYYAHVRTSCTGGVFSNWRTSSFTTITTSVATIGNSGAGVEAYPNPVTKSLVVKAATKEPATITITDLTGKLILTTQAQGEETNIDMEQIPSGIYLLKYSNSFYSQTLKVIKQ